MDANQINEAIQVVLETFGMSAKKAAEAMGISYDVFRQNRGGKNNNRFTEKHLEALKAYIRTKAGELS